MKVLLKKGPAADLDIQTLVVFSPSVGEKKKISLSKGDKALEDLIQSAVDDGAFAGKAKETVFFRNAKVSGVSHVLAVGLGDTASEEGVRVAVSAALTALKNQKVKSAAFHLESLTKKFRDAAGAVQAATEGLILSHYEFEEHKFASKDGKKADNALSEITLLANSTNKALETAIEVGTVLAQETNVARWLGDHSGNTMTPDMFAQQAVSRAKGTGLKVTVWDRKRIEKEKFGGLLGVSLGSSQDPRFVIMEYKGAGASKQPIYFVGKGLTFDSGGISIKPAANMDEMKYDMCGGAAVVGAMLAIAKLKIKVNAVALIPATENMPGPAANKPGDIMIARNGKTVEILNTDAEGRLVLADALSYATEHKPAAIFNVATLTGAIVVALGNTHTGVFTRDQKLLSRVQKAADGAGEKIWPMPVVDDHLEDMKGYHADLANISSTKGAGSSTAAAFLEQFVGEGIPFIHFDIAGTAWNVHNRLNYAPKKGASGVMVRTFVELAKSYT